MWEQAEGAADNQSDTWAQQLPQPAGNSSSYTAAGPASDAGYAPATQGPDKPFAGMYDDGPAAGAAPKAAGENTVADATSDAMNGGDEIQSSFVGPALKAGSKLIKPAAKWIGKKIGNNALDQAKEKAEEELPKAAEDVQNGGGVLDRLKTGAKNVYDGAVNAERETTADWWNPLTWTAPLERVAAQALPTTGEVGQSKWNLLRPLMPWTWSGRQIWNGGAAPK